MWLACFRWVLGTWACQGTACLHVFSMWLACLGAWACQGTSCSRQCTAEEAFDRRQTIESWKCKQCTQDSLAEVTFVCHACGKTKPEKDAFNKVSVKRRYCTQCSPGEYRGFTRYHTKGCGRWPMNDFSDHWLRGCVRTLTHLKTTWCATNASPGTWAYRRKIVNERLRRPNFCCANTTCKGLTAKRDCSEPVMFYRDSNAGL